MSEMKFSGYRLYKDPVTWEKEYRPHVGKLKGMVFEARYLRKRFKRDTEAQAYGVAVAERFNRLFSQPKRL